MEYNLSVRKPMIIEDYSIHLRNKQKVITEAAVIVASNNSSFYSTRNQVQVNSKCTTC